MIDRREFAAGLLALGAACAKSTHAQTSSPAPLKPISSGIVKPGAVKESQNGHSGQSFLTGLLAAGNIRLEAHESVQKPGAPHEAVGTHKHNEIWYVTRGVATLYINGAEHRMETGDVGIVCAGDQHWIANAGDTELAYFVLAVGPPE